ncbi:serine/threonine-protein kinase [Ideonella sp. DXS29W]|uniref:Serine/threonine-protein kinase n=1 Tax=Ideonella lacteola TaxID=2984193 RepID=A0ABU9BRH7_9BURK
MPIPLTANDIAALSRLLDELLALPASDRPAWLAALQPSERHLEPILRDMLAEHDGARAPVMHGDLPALGEPQDANAPIPGERVGPYRLLRQIGQGGMGSVWLAERADGALTRQVALKLPRMAWDAGLAARMARERDIGALLEHPHVARLYDAGVDELGRPYLAMEYIEGQAIDTWCAERGLGARERLSLFLQVVRAVAYAHARLVIHRDLKPANVLVSADGQAHLLDFGIARQLREPGAGRVSQSGSVPPGEQPEPTQTTIELHRAHTPRYASPEQINGEPLTVQSDVYSLGVMLYELLTGRSPIIPKRASPGAVEDAVLQGDAPLASSRVQDPAKARALRGDLDAILAQAMQREPARRYATANALADDIERHLCGQAVQARPNDWRYRLGKLLRRHWLAFSLSGLGLAAVLSLAGVALLQAYRAQQAAERARVVKDFVIDIFKLDTPGAAAGPMARELPIEFLLERGARLIEPRFAGQPELQAELLSVVAQVMLDMQAGNLAIEYASRFRSATANGSPEERARAALLLARALMARDLGHEAARVLRDGLALAPSAELRVELLLSLLEARLDGPEPEELASLLTTLRIDLALTRSPLLGARADEAEARFKAQAGDFATAISLHERAIKQALASQPPGSRLAARLQLRLAQTMARAGQYPAARQVSQQAVAALRELGGPDDIEAAVRDVEGVVESGDRAWRYAEADAVFARSFAVIDKFGRRVPAEVRARLEDHQACVALQFGQAEKAYALSLRSAVVLRGGDQPFGHASSCLGWAAAMTGHHVEAETEFQRYLGHLWHSHGCDTDCAASMYVKTAMNRLMRGDVTKARDLLSDLPQHDARFAEPAPDSPGRRGLQAARARIELDSGQLDAALALLQGLPDERYLMNDSAALRAEAECRSGRTTQAVVVLRERVRASQDHPDSPWLADLRARLGLCEALAGHAANARIQSRLAHQALKLQPGVSPAYRRVLSELDTHLDRMR